MRPRTANSNANPLFLKIAEVQRLTDKRASQVVEMSPDQKSITQSAISNYFKSPHASAQVPVRRAWEDDSKSITPTGISNYFKTKAKNLRLSSNGVTPSSGIKVAELIKSGQTPNLLISTQGRLSSNRIGHAKTPFMPTSNRRSSKAPSTILMSRDMPTTNRSKSRYSSRIG